MKGWTSEDISRVKAKQSAKQVAKKPKGTSQKSITKILDEYSQIFGYEWVTEYTFAKSRMFRFDYAIPDLKIAVEYEGLMASKSRHTTVTGYTTDTEKYNLAVGLGWDVIRVTSINLKDFELFFLRVLNKRLLAKYRLNSVPVRKVMSAIDEDSI